MKCCDIHSGMLNVRVFIEKKTRTDDAMGGVTEVWAEDPKGGVMAAIQNLSGTESFDAMRVSPGNLQRLTVRFRGDVNGAPYWLAGEHRIKIRGREHGILAIQDVEGRQQWLKIDTLEGRAS